MTSWKIYKISDIGRIVTGKTPKTSIQENYGGDVPFLTPSDDLTGKYSPKTSKTLTQVGLSEVKNCLLPANSICVSCIGSDLGKVVKVTQPTVTNQQFNSIIPNCDFDADFVYYLMTIVGKQLNYLSKTSTAVPIINKTQFSNFEVRVPSLEEQRRIAGILGAIDDKIENNRRINTNLELQAQALYKQWFVDNRSDDWETLMLDDVATLSAGGDKPQVCSDKKTPDCKIPIYSNGIDDEGLYGYTNNPRIKENSITISARGTIGFVCLRTEPYVPIVRLISVVPTYENMSAYFLYLWALTQNISGTGTTQQQLTVPAFRTTKIVVPSQNVLIKFNQVVKPIFDSIKQNKKENETLATLRDTLLPKLMNGEIKM